jgi:hypothetical protein
MTRRRSVLYFALSYLGGLLLAGVLALAVYAWRPVPESYLLPLGALLMWWLTDLLRFVIGRSARPRKFSAHPQGNGSVRRRSLTVVMPALQVRAAAEEAARTLRRARLLESHDWQLVLKVAGSWKSLGEEVRIDIEPRPTGPVVHVSSRLDFPSLVDYGKNQANVDMIVAVLEAADERYRSDQEATE